MAVVINVFFSVVWNQEVFIWLSVKKMFLRLTPVRQRASFKDWIGTGLILLGIALIAWISPPDEAYNIPKIMLHFQNSTVFIYFLFISLVLLGFQILATEKGDASQIIKQVCEIDKVYRGCYILTIFSGSTICQKEGNFI